MPSTIQEIQNAVTSLEYRKRIWEEEYNSRIKHGAKSNMNKSDIKFITKQIEKLKSLEFKTLTIMEEISDAMDKHTATW